MDDVTVLDGEWDLYHLDDVLASQYQSSDWTHILLEKVVSQQAEPFGSLYHV